jgi:long-subunit fatty acid transport protein
VEAGQEEGVASRVALPTTCWAMRAPAASMAGVTAVRWPGPPESRMGIAGPGEARRRRLYYAMLFRPRSAFLALFVLLSCAPARGQVLIPLTRTGAGARAMGMANAFVALSDDGTAATWNPAGLAQLRKPELSLVYNVNHRGLRFNGERSLDERFAFTHRRLGYATSSLDFASLSLPFEALRRPVTFQVGWQRLYQLDATLDGETTRRALGEPEGPDPTISVEDTLRGQIDIVSLAAAVKVTGRTSLGGSLNISRGHWRSQTSIVESVEAQSDFVSIGSNNRIRGHNFTAGLLLHYPSWNAGLVYHFPFWSRYSVDNEVRSNRVPTVTVAGGGSARFRFPRNLAAGVAWRPAPLWTVAADVNHDQWTDALVDRVRDRPEAFNFFDGAPPELSTTRDTLSFSVGMEHLFPREGSVVPLRLGFGWEPQGPMDPVTRDPVSYRTLSAGTGYNSNRLKLDVAVQYRWAGFQASDILSVDTALRGGLSRDAITRVGVREWRLKVSAIYRISDTKRVRGVIGRIFG